MHEDLISRIDTCIETILGYPLKKIGPNMRLQEDLEMESLQLVELQIELETAFSITFDPIEDDFFEIFQTIGTLYDAVAKKLED